MDARVIIQRLAEGFILNGKIFFLTLLAGLPLGLVISFGSMSKWTPFGFLARNGGGDTELPGAAAPSGGRAPTATAAKPALRAARRALSRFRPVSALVKLVVWIVRGTPLMLQLIIIFMGPGLIWGKNLWGSGETGRFWACVAAFIINYACYFSEIYRGGIEGVPDGQSEAAQVLGMTKAQTFFRVTLMQVIKRIVPPMGNEIITLVKDTSLARIIANQEIIMVAQNFTAKALIWPLFSTGLFFLAAVGVLTVLLSFTERKLAYFR